MTKPKRHVRAWTPEEKAAAIALLASNGGNVKATVRQFRTPDGAKVSESTLRGWRDDPLQAPPQDLVNEGKRSLDAILESVVGKIARGLDRPEAIARILSRPVQGATVAGILIDKMRVLRGQPSEITQTLSGFLSTAKWLPEAEKVEPAAHMPRVN